MRCGKPFSTKKSNLAYFCSIECKKEFSNKQRVNDDNIDVQIDLDVKALKKANNNDERLPKYR